MNMSISFNKIFSAHCQRFIFVSQYDLFNLKDDVMKKTVMAVVFISLTLGNSVFAGEREVGKRVLKAFEKEFTGAVDAQWRTYEEYVRVDFTFNNVPLIACYKFDGKRLALVRNIISSSLPLSLQFDLGKRYKDHWVTQLYELVNDEGTQYRLTLESADQIIHLRSNGSDDWEVVKEEEKK